VKAAGHGAMRAAQHFRYFADDEFALADGVVFRRMLVDADDDQIAVHRTFHRAAIDEDVGLFSATAEHGAVSVGMHANLAGVIRRELEQRVALAAHGDDDAVLLQLIDCAFDLLARGVDAFETLPDLFDRKHPAAAAAEEIGNRLSETGGTWKRERLRQRFPG
jgi:hypothetical protein